MIIMAFAILLFCWLSLVLLRKLQLTEKVYFSWIIPIFFIGAITFIGLMFHNIMSASGFGIAVFNAMLLAGWIVYILHQYKALKIAQQLKSVYLSD